MSKPIDGLVFEDELPPSTKDAMNKLKDDYFRQGGALGCLLKERLEKSDGSTARSKYHREIKPGVWVDVYDVLNAWGVSNPALSHLVKKALQPGQRGHKDRATDLDDIVKSAIRAKELG